MPNNQSHLKWLYAQLPEWQNKGWIDNKTAESLHSHYGPAESTNAKRLTSLLLSVGATLLIGAGIILILAHNWDELTRPVRAAIALLPLLVTYALGAHTLRRKMDSTPWRESSAAANIVALATAISLIAQTYNISGDIGRFLLTVSILSIPAIYLFRSTTAAILYLLIITQGRWATTNIWPDLQAYAIYWGCLALLAPYAYSRIREAGTAARLLTLAISVSIAISLTTHGIGTWGAIAAYALYCATLSTIASLDPEHQRISKLTVFAANAGLFGILLACGFRDIWQHANFFDADYGPVTIALLTTLATLNAVAIVTARRNAGFLQLYWGSLGILLTLLRIATPDTTGIQPATDALIANALAFGVGTVAFLQGYKRGCLAILNAGMLIIGATLLCRFFDSDLPFLARGIAFIAIGAAFLVINIKLGGKFKKERAQ